MRSRPNPLMPGSSYDEVAPPTLLLDRVYVYPRTPLEAPIEDNFVAPERGNLTFHFIVSLDCAGVGFYENIGFEIEKPDGGRAAYRHNPAGGDSITPSIYECEGSPRQLEWRDETAASLEGDWALRGLGECTCSLHLQVLATAA